MNLHSIVLCIKPYSLSHIQKYEIAGIFMHNLTYYSKEGYIPFVLTKSNVIQSCPLSQFHLNNRHIDASMCCGINNINYKSRVILSQCTAISCPSNMQGIHVIKPQTFQLVLNTHSYIGSQMTFTHRLR